MWAWAGLAEDMEGLWAKGRSALCTKANEPVQKKFRNPSTRDLDAVVPLQPLQTSC